MLYTLKQWKIRNRIDLRLVSNKIDYLKWTSKRNYMSQKIFDNNLVGIRKKAKRKLKLTLNKPEYTGMHISHLSKVLV